MKNKEIKSEIEELRNFKRYVEEGINLKSKYFKKVVEVLGRKSFYGG